MQVKSIIQTCKDYPSQWEGRLIDGRMFYARYRYGILTVEVSKETTIDVYKAMGDSADLICEKILGDEYDGMLETSTLIHIMRDCGFVFELCEH